MIAPDSSVVVAALGQWHPAHELSRAALVGDQRGLVAHVAYESASALSRMPEPYRVAPSVVLESLENDYPDAWLVLTGSEHLACLRRATAVGLRGGALYDALIAVTASDHGATLLSADRRARTTYEAMGAKVEYLEP